jgi:hypothetical protein
MRDCGSGWWTGIRFDWRVRLSNASGFDKGTATRYPSEGRQLRTNKYLVFITKTGLIIRQFVSAE